MPVILLMLLARDRVTWPAAARWSAGGLALGGAVLLLSAKAGLFGYRESLAVPYAESSLVLEFMGTAVLLVATVVVLAGRRAYDSPENVTEPGSVARCRT